LLTGWLMLLSTFCARGAAQDHANWADNADADYHNAPPEAVEAWKDLKYGMRIHWGVYSVLGMEASWPPVAASPEFRTIYNTLYQVFNPTSFDADQWANLMSRCGFKYFVFTAKHHDGFCMFHTESTVQAFRRVGLTYNDNRGIGKIEQAVMHYDIRDTLFRRDIVGELADAARKRGIGVGLYYSNHDWFDRDQRFFKYHMFYDPTFNVLADPVAHQRMVKRQLTQLSELCTKYGPIQQIDLDAGWPKELWPDMVRLIKEARGLQPKVMLRERGIGPYGDFTTPEHWVPADGRDVKTDSGTLRKNIPWQAIEQLGSAWAYQPNDTYKPKEWLVATLVDCCAKGGNFMPGVSPMANGQFPSQTIERLEYAGAWLKVNGEAIYATRPREGSSWKEGPDVRFTRSKDGKYVYAISLRWPGRELRLGTVRAAEGSAIRMLGYPEALAWRQNLDCLTINIPEQLQTEANRPSRQAYAFKIPVP
jgi:alpha-L-fucosidase